MTDKKPWEALFDNLGKALDKMPDEIFPGASAILFNERDEVLLQCRSDNDRWSTPGGRMEIGESAEACAIRETVEETGLTTRIKRLVGVYSDPANYAILRYPSGHTVHCISIVYEVTYVSGEIRISEESTAVRWFPVDGLPDGITPAARIRIEDALTRQVEAFSR